MDQDLYNRLKRLGVVRGVRRLKSADEEGKKPGVDPISAGVDDQIRYRHKGPIEKLIPRGRVVDTDAGSCFVVDHVYPVHYRHGFHTLDALVNQVPDAAAIYCHENRFKDLDFTDFLFLDTETTGLAGAGTIAFMVGVGFFEKSISGLVFIVRQYFLRDHGDEPAMLILLESLLSGKTGLVTFNGRTFDAPLLNTRYLMNRMPSRLPELPHLDLLGPSRRLWRYRLGSVALGALEVNLLGLRRTEEDVPGWLIPNIYNDYLRSGDAREIQRIFYHNEIDMLSMVTLAAVINRQFKDPTPDDDPVDIFSLGKWQVDLGLVEVAESNLRMSLSGDLPLSIYHHSLMRLGLLLKRTGRRNEAVPFWQQWAATSLEDIQAHVELAKYYEWDEKDFKSAAHWTREAIGLTKTWKEYKRVQVRQELDHRLARLQRKSET